MSFASPSLLHSRLATLVCAIACTWLLSHNASAAPKPNKRHLTVQRISPPTMTSPGRNATLRTNGNVTLQVKLVYAHNRERQFTDQTLRRDLPKLSHITGFNAYKLMRKIQQTAAYQRPVVIRISKRFKVKLNPKGYIQKSRKIALKVTFLYRISKGKRRGQFAAYATTNLRLKNNRQVAFVGPAHQRGRAILLLTATKK